MNIMECLQRIDRYMKGGNFLTDEIIAFSILRPDNSFSSSSQLNSFIRETKSFFRPSKTASFVLVFPMSTIRFMIQ